MKKWLGVALAVGIISMTAMNAMAQWNPMYYVPQDTITLAFSMKIGSLVTSAAFGEGVQVYFNADGTTTAYFDPKIGTTVTVPGYSSDPDYGATYDAPSTIPGDDVVIAFINNSGVAVPSVTLSGSGPGGNLFVFDNDDAFGVGVKSITAITPTATGPGSPPSCLSSECTTGTVNFSGAGLANGSFAWYAFESSASSFMGNFTARTAVPEPATLLLLGFGLIGVAGLRRRFTK